VTVELAFIMDIQLDIELFAVVEWTGYSPPLVSIVPSNWLVMDGTALCSYWSPRPVDDTVVKKRIPPQSKWPKYEVELLASAGN